MSEKKKLKIFERLVIAHPSYDEFVYSMNGVYERQVLHSERERMIAKARLRNGHRDVTEQQLQQTVDHYQRQYLEWIALVNGKPALAALGSSRNETTHEIAISAIEAIAARAVPRNVGIFHGEWHMGYMGVYKRTWLTLKEDYSPGWAFSSGVPLIGQEIGKMDAGEKDECPEWYRALENDATSPPHATFLGRTTSLVGAPLTVGCLYAAPGKGTMEEFHRVSLAAQMRKRNLTMYSWRPDGTIPNDYVIDQPLPSGGWLWDFLLMETQDQIMIGTVDSSEFENLFVLRIGNEEQLHNRWEKTPANVKWFDSPEELGDFVVDTAYEKWKLLVNTMADEMRVQNGNNHASNT